MEDETEIDSKKEAYLMGYEEGIESGKIAKELNISEEELEEHLDDLEDSITSSARYANFTLPELRRLAGCKDAGYGTYTDCDEDADWELAELVDAYFDGLYEGFYEGYKK